MRPLFEKVRRFVQNTFDIRDGEFARAILMQTNIFLIITTLLIVKPAVNGLFISKFGVESLPFAFILVSIFAAGLSTVYSTVLSKKPMNHIFIGVLFSSVIALVIFGLLLRLNFIEGWILYLFYIWTAIFAVLTASQFWIMANLVFNAREAKRLFGFIGSGAIAGGIFGGYLTTILADGLGSENLLFVAAFLLSFCIPITQEVWKKNVQQGLNLFQQKKRLTGFTEHPFFLIKNSKHLTYLATIIGVSVLVAKLVEYQFSAVASQEITNPDDLTSFFGFWFSNFNVISLLVQLFLTRRIVGTQGVGTSLLILPGGIALGAILLFFFPVLGVAIFIKMCDGSLKQSINKAAIELLALPVPVDIKNQTKTFIDVFIDSTATGISGIILIFVVSGLDLSIPAISLIILFLIGIWIYFVLKVRKSYLTSFKQSLNPHLPFENQDLASNGISAIESILKTFQAGTEEKILFALKQCSQFNFPALVPGFLKLLEHPSYQIRAEAINNLYFYQTPNESERMLKMALDHSQTVKVAAFDYLLLHYPKDKVALFEKFLTHPEMAVAGAALVSLAKDARHNPSFTKPFQLEKKVGTWIQKIESERNTGNKRLLKISVIKAIGLARMASFFPFLEKMLYVPEQDIRKEAILAAGQSLDLHFLHSLLPFLENTEYTEVAQKALSEFGPEIFTYFSNLMEKGEIPPSILTFLPGIAEKIDHQKSVDFLFSLLKIKTPKVKVAALRALNKLKMQYPHLKFSHKEISRHILSEAKLYQQTLSILYAQTAADSKADQDTKNAREKLIMLLENGLDINLERIFRLLGLQYFTEDVLAIFESLQSQQNDLRINALEFLDNLLEPNLKKILIPIIETTLLDNLTEEVIRHLNLTIPDDFTAFKELLDGSDPEIKEATKKLILSMKDNERIQLLLKTSNSLT